MAGAERNATEATARPPPLGHGLPKGTQVMVVEDEIAIASLIEEIFADNGCQVVGPFSTLATALHAAADAAIDVAVLDVNLSGERVYPVAELLATRRIPFLLLSGYGQDGVPAGHQDWAVCAKPFRHTDLVRAVARLLAAPAPPNG